MIASLLVFILVASAFASDLTPAAYSGFRVSIKKDLLSSYYGLDLKSAISAVPAEKWGNLNFTYGKGAFSLGFFMTDIKCTAAKFDETKGSVKKFDVQQDRILMDLAGQAASVDYSFTYEFDLLGIPFLYGKANLHFVSSLLSIDQNFTNDDAPTAIKTAWTISVDGISGLDLWKGISRSINSLAPSLGHTLDNVYAKALQKVVMGNLHYWMEIKTPFYPNNLLDMTLHSVLYDLHEYPLGYVSMGFFTEVAVDDRPYNRLVWKVHRTDTPLDGAKEQICVGTSLITSMAEIRGKARDFLFSIKPADLGLSGKISDLITIMPRLDEIFDDDETLTVGCRPNGDNNIVMIQDGKQSNETARIQIPINCVFGGMPTGKVALSLNFVIRGNVKKVFEDTEKLIGVNGYVHVPELFSYTVDSAAVPVADNELIIRMLQKIALKLENFKLLPKPLAVPITFVPTTNSTFVTDHEYCINYS